MDFKLEKQTITISKVFSEYNTSQAIDLEMNLPDYCSDIKSIIKCFLCPNINAVQVAGQRLSCCGNVMVRLVYVNDNDKLDAYEQTVELSKFMEAKDLPENAIVTAKAEVQYVNCRAVSQRRANVNANVSIIFCVQTGEKLELPHSTEGSSVECENETVQMQSLLSQSEKTFDLSETITIPSDKPPIGKILRSSAWAVIDSKKTVANKILVKGNLFIEILYSSDSSDMEFEKFTHTMPVSQIIELMSIDENTDCDVSLDVRSLILQTKTDSKGESKLVEIACKISAFVKALINDEVKIITDCYSTKYDVQAEYALQNFEKSIYKDEFERNIKSSIELASQEINQVIDVWCNKASSSVNIEKDLAKGIATLALSVIFIDENEKVQYNEKNIDYEFEFKLKDEYENLKTDAKIQIEKIEFSKMGKDKIELKIQARISVDVLENQNKRVCSDIIIDEANVKNEDSSALTVYFSSKGEKVWDIAKKYNTTIKAINEENSLDSSFVEEECMLIIPCV